MASPGRGASTASTAFYARLIPQTSDTEEVEATFAALEAFSDDSVSITPPNRIASAARALERAVLPESRFYRVLHESKLYTIECIESSNLNLIDSAAESGVQASEFDEMRRFAPSLAESDYKLVQFMEITTNFRYKRTLSSRTRQEMQQQDRHGYSVLKMPQEIVASSGRLQCLVGPSNTPTWFIRLQHVPNAYVQVSQKGLENPATFEPHTSLELLPLNEKAIQTFGRFYYRVVVSMELCSAPDLLAQGNALHLLKKKNVEEIIESHETYQCPHSSVTFVKLAYEEGWLVETLLSGIPVLERLATEPAREDGKFFYIVQIPVGVRVAPHIMAQRTGQGFPLHSIVEGTQRFTPPQSRITYVRVEGKGWLFETTMDGQLVLERMEVPLARHVARQFYRVLKDVTVLSMPIGNMEIEGGLLSVSTPRKRLKNTLIECSERLVPAFNVPCALNVVEMGFLKLRHDAGWICEREFLPPYRRVLLQVHGHAKTQQKLVMYRVLQPVFLRSAPDLECPRLPGVALLTPGTVFESSLQYTPPESRITYVKVASASHVGANSTSDGWLFDNTLTGERVLEPVNDAFETKHGKFFFRVVSPKKKVLVSPEKQSDVLRYLVVDTIFAAEMSYTLPHTQETYVRLSKEKGWVALDLPHATYSKPRSKYHSLFPTHQDETLVPTLVRLSEVLYHLYTLPPSWVSLGYPTRTWFKVPDESCRTILAEETSLQMAVFESRQILASSSQGREGVPLSREGTVSLQDGKMVWKCTLEEIKHSASALLTTFPWKQVWWILELQDRHERHCVELQHGLRGGFRRILLDGEPLLQHRTVVDMLWDAGSESTFAWLGQTFKVVIALEGAFFSPYLQFYSYTLVVNDTNIKPLDL
ncbi:hypothetical protein CCR75_002093 [Bremia lactucae]|uniref:Uncharacterized protein n=1 Tax=Bremia lactucae TaxID=4779 RepID=A0A976FNW0_BRELC|nr:hypothetical protein CCR75_002093 [Bremia lactucae]